MNGIIMEKVYGIQAVQDAEQVLKLKKKKENN